MKIDKIRDGSKLTIAVDGRIDSMTAPNLSKELDSALDGVTELVFDFEKMEYISSAGLRVMLIAQRRMNKQGTMIIKNSNEIVRNVFDITEYSDILTIQ